MKNKIRIFADGANVTAMLKLNKSNLVSGFTTNPSLMHSAGVKNYENFCKLLRRIICSIKFILFCNSSFCFLLSINSFVTF